MSFIAHSALVVVVVMVVMLMSCHTRSPDSVHSIATCPYVFEPFELFLAVCYRIVDFKV